jgi:hypothetical protein
MPSSYQVGLWKQESFVVLRPLQIEFFRNLLENPSAKFRYVMACNEQLANEVVQLLNLKNGAVIEFKDPSH